MFALAIIVWLVVKYTKFGRRVYAVGGNENAAYLAGINVKNFKLLIYGINGLFVTFRCNDTPRKAWNRRSDNGTW